MKASRGVYVIQIVLLLLLVCMLASAAMAQANLQGRWRTLDPLMPINPVHVALLHSGKVLVVAGSGNCAPGQTVPAGQPACPLGAPYGPANNSGALLYDPVANSFTQFTLSWDMFCNGMVVLPDGRAFINGGTLQYDPFYGETRSAVFDPSTNVFTNVQNMAHGRWYPTVTTLGDGRVMTFSGLKETGGTSTTVEIYTAGAGWSQEYGAGWTPPLYPRMHLLPNGNVFYSGSSTTSRLFDPAAHSWSTVANTQYPNSRTYGSSVLLPLTPENNYDPRVMIMGGGTTATATSEIIDLGAPTPTWQFGPNMSGGRIEMNAVILPNGKVLAIGGSSSDENESTATFTADLFDPSGPTVSSASANTVPRVYHSVALLLPDATVWLAGGNYTRGFYQHQMEIYEPAYLFSGVDSNGNPIPATRPSISSAPVAISYGSAFTVETPNAADISSVVLVRPGASTHAFDMDQRLVGLSFSHDAGALNVTGPPSGNIAPPGYYMLFVLNSAGTPSLASFIQLTQAPPDFSVSATPSSRTAVQGSSTTYSVSVTALNGFNGNVGLSASGLPAGASASFSPTTISSAGSSTLTINTAPTTPAGSYPIIITATSGSLTHTTSIALIVTVPSDFTISASPASQIISRGARTTYSVSIGAQGPFSGTVTLTLSGLPKKTTSSFTPSSITGPGTSILKVSANPTAAAGTYTLTIKGTSGGFSHSTTVGLTIQ